MFDTVSHWLLRILRVPPEPEPPFGAAGSVRVFRAGKNYYRLRFYLWLVKQAFAVAGIVFWLSIMGEWRELRQAPEAAPPSSGQTNAEVRPSNGSETNRASARQRRERKSPEAVFREISGHTPNAVFALLWVAEGLAILGYLIQLPLTYAAVRLDYEQRWYVVTDRSLRIRHGLWNVREMTMSFANLQHLTVTQGPLQRLLRIADLRVQSAGGGGGGGQPGHSQATASLHIGFFHGVENAAEVRDLILERLRRFRETGLGDPDEAHAKTAAIPTGTSSGDAQAAARELLLAARQLRESLSA